MVKLWRVLESCSVLQYEYAGARVSSADSVVRLESSKSIPILEAILPMQTTNMVLQVTGQLRSGSTSNGSI